MNIFAKVLGIVRYNFVGKKGGSVQVAAINFIYPLNLKFKCEFKFTKYLRGAKYLFAIYQTSQIQIPLNQKIFKLDRI